MNSRGRFKKNMIQKIITFTLILALLLAAFLTGTLANTVFKQHKTGVASGVQYYPVGVLLNKYERGKDGSETTKPIKGASFALFKVDQQGAEPQIGGLYETNEQGQIFLEAGLDPGDYYFKEIAPAYSYTYDMQQEEKDAEYPFEIPFIEDPSQVKLKVINAYNSRSLKELTIRKWVENSDATPLSEAQKEEAFTFLIHLGDEEEAYPFSLYDESNGKIKEGEIHSNDAVDLSHGQRLVIEDLPLGLSYDVEEELVEGYGVISNNHKGNISEDQEEVEFRNIFQVQNTGSLTINKTLLGARGIQEKEFRFQVYFSDGGTYSYEKEGESISFTSGDILHLKHEEQVVFKGLPMGLSYEIVELDEEGYISGIADMSGKIIQAGVTGDFYNYDGIQEGNTGSLRIEKEVTGIEDDQEQLFAFKVVFEGLSNEEGYLYQINDGEEQWIKSGDTLMLGSGDYAVIRGIPEGLKYDVTESDYSDIGYVSSLSKIGGTILGNIEIPLHFLSEKQPVETPSEGEENALIRVRKVVLGERPEEDQEKAFEFILWVDGEPREFQLKDQEEIEFRVPVGSSYEVEEMDYQEEGYENTSITKGFGTVPKGEVEVVQTNTYIGRVYKKIQGEKTWDLSANPSAVLPESVTLYLKNNNLKVASVEVRADENGKWNYEFCVPKYDIDGNEIIYVLEEEPVDGYESVVQGYHIKNILLESGPEEIETEEEIQTGEEIETGERETEKEISTEFSEDETQPQDTESIITESEEIINHETDHSRENQSKPITHDQSNPKTQDDAQLLLWGALLSMSLAVMSLIRYLKKEE
ncbi:MAG TPA: Cna B-type domain-containing protein [Candidatus Merdenecus merdavium]|nr:Cna B-type domain-containing protein [Candidatus Merdenecus merdavium]